MQTIRPNDLVVEATAREVIGFGRSKKLSCCYSCCYCWPDLKNWRCTKHGLIFGDVNSTETYSNMIEFICDDFARGERVE